MINKTCPDKFSTSYRLGYQLFIIFIVTCIAVSHEILSGQNSDVLESEYQLLSVTLNLQKSLLDSLKIQLEVQARRIDAEKDKEPANEENIKLLLVQSVSLADKIDKQQSNIAETDKELSSVRETLIKRYEKDLDSLAYALKESITEEAAGKLQNQILQITQKKLLIQPDPLALSFDPGKIMTLRIDSAPDENTKYLYLELVETALTEVHQKRKHVGNILRELEALKELRRRAQRFVDRSDLASGPPGSVISVGQSELRGDTEPAITFDGLKSMTFPQVHAYVYMWHQLDQLPVARKSEWISPIDSTKIYSSPQEFFTLLTDLDRRLNEYEQVLKQMLNSAY